MANFQETKFYVLIVIEILRMFLFFILRNTEKKRDRDLFNKNKNFEFEDKFRFWRLYVLPFFVFIIVLIEIFNKLYNYFYFNIDL